MKRSLLTVLLAMTLLAFCLPARAESGRAYSWSLSFETAAPGETEADRALSELLNILEAEGTWAASGGAFTLDGVFRLDPEGRSDTDFRVYGREERWIAESSLIGRTSLMFNNPAMLEFALKLRNHMGLPVERLPLLYPYVWTDALTAPVEAWGEYIRVPEGNGKISGADLLDFTKRLSELADTDRAFSCLVRAVYADSEDDRPFADLPRTLASWLDTYAPDGIDVIRDENGETWQANGWTVYSRSADGANTMISVPNPFGGSLLYLADETGTDGTRTLRLSIGHSAEKLDARLTVDPEGSVTLTLSGQAATDLPMPVLRGEGEHAKLHISTIGDEGGVLDLRLDRNSGGWTLRGADGRDLLRVRFTAGRISSAVLPAWRISQLNGVNVYSLDDSSLRDLVTQVRGPVLRGGMKLVSAAPVPTVVALMDWIEANFLDTAGTMYD